MKLVEIASGSGSGQPWTFGQETEEDSDDEEQENSSKNNKKDVCNGHTSDDAEKKAIIASKKEDAEKITSVDSGLSDGNAEGSDNNKSSGGDAILSSSSSNTISNGGEVGQQQQPLSSPPSSAQGSTTSAMSPPTSICPTAAAAARKVDPVTEVCPDLQVKIADLGNACWVVSWRKTAERKILHCFVSFFLFCEPFLGSFLIFKMAVSAGILFMYFFHFDIEASYF